MWMMGYNNGSDFNFPSPDHHHHHHHYSSFHGSRRLRPLIPRPLPNPPPSVNRLHAADFFPLNHHFPSMGGGDHNKRDSFQAQAQPVVVSSRWNPTPEQLRALEELYRRGTRTPSADQIQHITAQLRRYGKIEGKNVFYWFQNHKARERQKRRRQMESDDDHSNINNEVLEKKDSSSSTPGGANRTLYVETTNNWTPPTKCCSEAQAEAGLVQTEAAAVAQTRTGGWPSLAEEELQPTRDRNATWQPVQLSSPPSSSPYCAAAKVTAAPPSPTTTPTCNIIRGEEEGITGVRDVCQTLQLFPLGGGGCRDDSEEAGISSAAGMNISHSTYQFFEFLPVKN